MLKSLLEYHNQSIDHVVDALSKERMKELCIDLSKLEEKFLTIQQNQNDEIQDSQGDLDVSEQVSSSDKIQNNEKSESISLNSTSSGRSQPKDSYSVKDRLFSNSPVKKRGALNSDVETNTDLDSNTETSLDSSSVTSTKRQKVAMATWKRTANMIWSKIADHRAGNLFLKPSKDPLYAQIVKQPMCLEQVKSRIRSKAISNTAEFHRDVMQVLANAVMFSPEDDFELHAMALEMKQYVDSEMQNFLVLHTE
ncbi:Bromodomain-containing protein [Globomyces pollinis-pini]|nr:Bromodomain-containing protein [Globomyces pollinis-pini]